MKKHKFLPFTFIADILLLLAFIFIARMGIISAILLSQSLMWLFRLYFINQVLCRYILRRFVHLIPILLIIIACAFLLLQLAPGDFFTLLELEQDQDSTVLDRYREQFGLNRHWTVQFLSYIAQVLQGNFGFSALYRSPVFAVIQQRVGPTLLLSLGTLILSWGFSVPLGIYAAKNQYKFLDQAISNVAFVGLAIPNFFLAFLLLYVVTSTSGGIQGTWLPIGGMTSINFSQMGPIQQVLDVLWHLTIPLVVLTTGAMAGLTRVMRANMVEAMNQQYIITARAKGQNENKIIFRHALRNAINPMITLLGFQISNILGGAAITEAVLSWPGLGSLILAAILSQDTYLVMGSLIYSSILLVIGNLIADILLAVSDPRVRVG